MDIISTLSKTISLAQRLKEISKNVSEAEFQDLLADLLNQLSSTKLEVASLKEQLVVLINENQVLKNKKVDETEKYLQLAKVLTNIKISIPSVVNNGESETINDLFSIFVNIQKQLVTGITNKAGQQDRTYWLYYEICPKLKIYGAVNLENIGGLEYQRFSLSDEGQKLLNKFDEQKLQKNDA